MGPSLTSAEACILLMVATPNATPKISFLILFSFLFISDNDCYFAVCK